MVPLFVPNLSPWIGTPFYRYDSAKMFLVTPIVPDARNTATLTWYVFRQKKNTGFFPM